MGPAGMSAFALGGDDADVELGGDAERKDPQFTLHTKTDSVCLDYVFSSRDLPVLGRLTMPYDEEVLRSRQQHALNGHLLDPFPPCPNPAWPSDHLAVGVVVDMS